MCHKICFHISYLLFKARFVTHDIRQDFCSKKKGSRIWSNYEQVIGTEKTRNSEALYHHDERCVDVGGAC